MSLPKLREDYFTLDRPQHYVHIKNKNERINFINYLIKEGYSFTYTPWANYENCIETNLPLVINIKEKSIGHSGNVTCAACAATSKVILTIDEFMNYYFKNIKLLKL